MKREKYKDHIALGITSFLVLAAALLLSFALEHIQIILSFFGTIGQILRPIFYGMILTFLLLPIHRRLRAHLELILPNPGGRPSHKRGIANLLAIAMSIGVAALLVYLLLAMLIPQVYFSIVGFIQSTPDYIRAVQQGLTTFWEDNPEFQAVILPYYNSLAQSIQNWLQSDILPKLESVGSTIEWVRTSILPSLSSVATNLSTVLFAGVKLVNDLFVSVIVTVYLLLRKDILAAQTKKVVYSIFTPKTGNLIVEETRSAYRILSGFINGKLLDSLIIGVIALVCCNLLKFPYPVLLATVIGITNVIPFFGPFIGAIPCSILTLLVSPKQFIPFIIFILVLQQFDGNILGPKILGDSTGIDAFWVVFSVLLFGGLFGFAGMVMGVPIFAMLFSIVRRLVRHGLSRHGLSGETEDYIGKTPPLGEE